MRKLGSHSRTVVCLAAAAILLLACATIVPAQEAGAQPAEKARLDIYGFAMLDMGYDFGQNDPDWFDVVRPTKLPAFEDEFGKDGRTYAGVRQSRFGVKAFIPTSLGEMKVTFEFELFGVGDDAGQTTFRLRHAYGELGHFGAGQTWSPFMDPDVFPNSIEYWGPSGMVFFRNVQIRWMPIMGDNLLIFALERPGASGDQGVYTGAPPLTGLTGRNQFPDLSMQYRRTGKWGHFQAAGILRKLHWDDTDADTPGHEYDLSGGATGWGINLSSNIKFAKDTLRMSYIYGEGVENYMNDATVDIAIKELVTDPADVRGTTLPVQGIVVFYDRTWSDKFTSTIGYSRIDIDNTEADVAQAFHSGQYGLVNLLYYPVPGLMLGPEFQWGQRKNNSDGWCFDDYRVQFSAKYSFNFSVGGKS